MRTRSLAVALLLGVIVFLSSTAIPTFASCTRIRSCDQNGCGPWTQSGTCNPGETIMCMEGSTSGAGSVGGNIYPCGTVPGGGGNTGGGNTGGGNNPPPPAACTNSLGVSCPPGNSSGGGGCCSPHFCSGGICKTCAPADQFPNQGIYGGCCGGLSIANNGSCKPCVTVGAPPGLTPNGIHVPPGLLVLSWGSAWGANGGYSLAVGAPVFTYLGPYTSHAIDVPGSWRGSTIAWAVRGANACGTSSATSTASFTVCRRPATPNLRTPSFGSPRADGKIPVNLDWGSGNDATHYANHWLAYVSGNASGFLTTTGYSLAVNPGCYNWHVVGLNNCNEDASSGISNFCTPNVTGTPTPTPGNCPGGLKADGEPCGGSGVCCASGSCVPNVSGTCSGSSTCKRGGETCGGGGGACCTGTCSAGHCTGSSTCKRGGETCGQGGGSNPGSQCCTGICTPDGGYHCGPGPTSTPTPTPLTPITNTPTPGGPTSTPTPTPLTPSNDAWIQLQDASFQGSAARDNPIPVGETFITVEKGIVAGFIGLGDDARSGGPRIETESIRVNTESYPAQASARKRPTIFEDGADITGYDKIYIAKEDDLIINTSEFGAGRFVVINKGGTVNINTNYSPSGSQLIIADKINIAAGVTQIDAILVAKEIDFGGGATPLTINGNIATNEISNMRSLTNNAVPAVKVIVKPQMYLDLLPQLSVIKVNWKKVN